MAGRQTHENISAIPKGVVVSDSEGSDTPDAETPEPVNYQEVQAWARDCRTNR